MGTVKEYKRVAKFLKSISWCHCPATMCSWGVGLQRRGLYSRTHEVKIPFNKITIMVTMMINMITNIVPVIMTKDTIIVTMMINKITIIVTMMKTEVTIIVTMMMNKRCTDVMEPSSAAISVTRLLATPARFQIRIRKDKLQYWFWQNKKRVAILVLTKWGKSWYIRFDKIFYQGQRVWVWVRGMRSANQAIQFWTETEQCFGRTLLKIRFKKKQKESRNSVLNRSGKMFCQNIT